MSRKKAGYPLIEGLEITAAAAEGKGIGRHNDIVVFVPTAVPGDVVNVQIRSKRRRFMEGYVVRYLKRSELRVEPVCDHFGVCGGCKWQNIPYGEQLRLKREQVAEQLRRIGKVELPDIPMPLPSKEQLFYRNKLEYTFSHRRWMTAEEILSGEDIPDPEALGFHIPGMFDKVLDIRKCWLQADPSNAIRLEIKRFCLDNGYTFYNMREHTGLMRNIIIRTSPSGGTMVIVVFALPEMEKIEKILTHVATAFPSVTSLMYTVNGKLNDSIGDRELVLFSGRDHICEEMEGLRFRIGGKSFYQTNSRQACELYRTVREFAELTGAETVYDLYTGIGTIANFIAAQAALVIGIEQVPEAVEDARANSAINGIANTRFHAGDMKELLSDGFIAGNGRPDVMILDPPRAGIHSDVAGTILGARPRIIVYVSCNPATQARDIALFDGLYAVARVQPVDMFPHTHHIENVVQLRLRG